MKKILTLSFLSIIHLTVFSQTTKLWVTAKANAGTINQVNSDLEVASGTEILNLASSTISCISSNNNNSQTYRITVEDDYDGNGSLDQVTFDLVAKAYENSSISYSEVENASSMTSLGTESTISIGSNVWGVNNSDNISDIDEGETVIFTVENLLVSNIDSKYELNFDGFNLLGLEETNGGNTHKIIKGQGTGLTSYSINFSTDRALEDEEVVILTGAGSVTTPDVREWGLSSIRFAITVNDTESGGFNDLSDYSLFSNASNFGDTYPDQTREVNQSEFCWDKIPRWLAVRNTQAMTDAEIEDIASHYQIILLEKANNQDLNFVDDGMVSFATRLKAENPEMTTLFYWNTWINYGGYRADIEYDQNANEWSDLDNNGNPVLFKDLYYTYNYEVEAMRDWWIQTPLDALQNDVIDGVFIDKVVYAAFKDIYPNGQPINNYVKMLTDLYDAMPEGKKVIGNIIRTERTNSNRALMEVADGSYMERWAFPGTALDEAEATAISIQAMREALSKGKEIHFQTSPHDTGGDAEPDDFAGKVQYAKDNVNYPLAIYLIFAEKGAYFSYQVSVNARSSAQEAWNTSFVDEFSYRLGAPLGPPTKDGYVYQRSYENVDVWVDLVTKEAVLDWKDKTKITTTECTVTIDECENTTALIEAECFDEMSGIKTGTVAQDFEYVGWTIDGDWTRYNNIDLSGMNSVNANVASNNSTGGTLEIRLDGLEGELIGSIAVEYTQGWESYVTKEINITSVDGIHDVYVVFKGEGNALLNLNSFGFTKSVITGTNDRALKEIKVYPNPANNDLYINGGKGSVFELYTSTGEIKLSSTILNDQHQIDMTNYTAGIYFLKVNSVNGSTLQKIVKE